MDSYISMESPWGDIGSMAASGNFICRTIGSRRRARKMFWLYACVHWITPPLFQAPQLGRTACMRSTARCEISGFESRCIGAIRGFPTQEVFSQYPRRFTDCPDVVKSSRRQAVAEEFRKMPRIKGFTG